MRTFQVIITAGAMSLSCGLMTAKPEVMQLEAVEVGKGPLLFFTHATGLHVLDPHREPRPGPLRLTSNSRVRPVARVSDRKVVMEREFRHHVADLRSGRCVPFLDSDDRNTLVAVEGMDIFFLRQTETDDFSGMQLTSGKDGKTVVERCHRPRDLLHRLVVGGGEPAELVSPVVIEKLLATDKDGFWVITADAPQQLAKIDRKGGVVHMIPFDARWVASDTAHAFSPGRRFLALSLLHREQDFHSERTLVVCDLERREVCFRDAKAPISLFFSYPPPLSLDWRDDAVLCYGGFLEGARGVNVKTRTRLDEAAAAKLVNPPVPPEAARESRGLFELEFGCVFFPGSKEPIASALDERGVMVRDLAVREDGLFAAYSDPKDNTLYLIDGAKRSKMLVMSGWCHGLAWK